MGRLAANPANRWLASYDAQQLAAIQRTAWDGGPRTPAHYTRSFVGEGVAKSMAMHGMLDRSPLVHAAGDEFGECASQIRVDETFESLCSQRLTRTPPVAMTLAAAERIGSRAAAAEERVRQQLRDRLERKRAAELRMLPAPPPGSRAASRRRAEWDAVRHRSVSSDGGDAWARWERQFAGGRGRTERLTGQYVHSLGDVGRIERVPAEHKENGRGRVTTPKSQCARPCVGRG